MTQDLEHDLGGDRGRADALEDGSMAVFTTREAAEEFVRADPFVLHWVVRNWTIREWKEALVPDLGIPA